MWFEIDTKPFSPHSRSGGHIWTKGACPAYLGWGQRGQRGPWKGGGSGSPCPDWALQCPINGQTGLGEGGDPRLGRVMERKEAWGSASGCPASSGMDEGTLDAPTAAITSLACSQFMES